MAPESSFSESQFIENQSLAAESLGSEAKPLGQEVSESDQESIENTVEFGGVRLARGSGHEEYVPRASSTFTQDSFTQERMQALAVSFALNQPVLQEGGTSLGKSTIPQQMAAELGWSVHKINLTGTSDNRDLMGTYTPNPEKRTVDDPEFIFADGPVTAAIREAAQGNRVMLMIDEINAAHPGVLIRLHEVLDQYEKSGEITLSEDGSERLQVIKENLVIVANANPPSRGSSQYASRDPLDPAQLRRWNYQKLPDELPENSREFYARSLFGLESEPSPRQPESSIVTPDHTLSQAELATIPGISEMVTKYLEFHQHAQQLVKNDKISQDQPQRFTYDDREEPRRVMEYVAHFYNGDINQTFQQALEYYYVNKLANQTDRDSLTDLIKTVSYTPPTDSRRRGLGSAPETLPNHEMGNRVEFLRQMLGEGASPREVLPCLAGDESKEAQTLRHVYENAVGGYGGAIAKSYAGVATREAAIYRTFQYALKNWSALAHSLVGMDETTVPLYNTYIKSIEKEGNQNDFKALLTAMAGKDTDQSWAIIRKAPFVNMAVAKALIGNNSPQADNMRQEWAKEGQSKMLVESLKGVESNASFEVREEYLKSDLQRLVSLSGVNDVRGYWDRERAYSEAIGHDSNGEPYIKDHSLFDALIASLSNVDSRYANQVRREIDSFLSPEGKITTRYKNWIIGALQAREMSVPNKPQP